MINLQVKRNIKLTVDPSLLIRSAEVTLEEEGSAAGADLSIIIAGDAFVKKLNQQYRHQNSTTDVLSFSTNEVDPDTRAVYLGEVILSLPRAREQASAGGHPLLEELQLLVVHGTLHLLGYDHIEKSDAARMQPIQNKLLSKLGVNLAINLSGE